ncbi:hypothetical protein K1T35_47985 (plasmid) [Pseudonocardia sp. DSM 110487]|uniref:hypothetical protein n=1 Tax=Pseudonocardia sp. DSM 110487 TaxID=2865833 RepID=UPI001C6A17C9|nr:hypothetical protein [Pseudonocardia sp. DSM 110487]QYN41092.1 hypothetical protein K1T35_47985 [Pseudonocardia sp. DSM 110487]
MTGSVERRPAEVAAAALRSAFAARSVALVDRRTGQQPTRAAQCGWELRPGATTEAQCWQHVGTPIGWTDGDRIWLNPAAATDAIIQQANAAGHPLNLTRSGLGRALADAGILRSRDTAQGRRTTVKIRLGDGVAGPGTQMTVWDAPWTWLWPESDDAATASGPGLGDLVHDQAAQLDEEPRSLAPQPDLFSGAPMPDTSEQGDLEDGASEGADTTDSPVGEIPASGAVGPRTVRQRDSAATSGGDYAGIALVAAIAFGWLARPGEPARPVELGKDASSLGSILRLAERMNLGHRDGGGRDGGGRADGDVLGQLWLLPQIRERLGLPARLRVRAGDGEPADHRAVRGRLEAEGWQLGSEVIGGWTVVCRDGGRQLYLVIPEWQVGVSPADAPFDELTEPAQVVATRLGAYAATAGVAYTPEVSGPRPAPATKEIRPQPSRPARATAAPVTSAPEQPAEPGGETVEVSRSAPRRAAGHAQASDRVDRHSDVEVTVSAGYRGVALLVDAEVGWLARPEGLPRYIELGEDAESLDSLLRLAERLNLGHRNGRGRYTGAFHGYGQLWLLPQVRERLGLPAEVARETGNKEPVEHLAVREMLEAAGWELGSKKVSGWNVIYRKGGRNLHLVVPEWQDEESPFGELTEPTQTVAARLGAFAARAGVVYSYSPGVTGVELIKTTRPDIARAPRPELPKPSTLPTLEKDYLWQRTLQPDEEAMPWVDAWDVNAMYLGAATSLPLGIGAPDELTEDVQFDANLPGYWRIASPPAWEHARLPDPLQVAGRNRGNDNLWVTTPTMKILTELYDLNVEITKAWVWRPVVLPDGELEPNAVRVLDKWAKELREARKSLLGAVSADDRAVLNAVKLTYKHGVGRLDAGVWRDLEPNERPSTHRPDWRHHVVAQGRYALTRRIVTAAKSGHFPLAISTDAVLYASDSPEPVPPPGWVRGEQLGQVKHLGRLRTEQVAPFLAAGDIPKGTKRENGEIVEMGLFDSFERAGGDQ